MVEVASAVMVKGTGHPGVPEVGDGSQALEQGGALRLHANSGLWSCGRDPESCIVWPCLGGLAGRSPPPHSVGLPVGLSTVLCVT